MVTTTLKRILAEADRNRRARIFVVYGGQGAGKTVAISQILIDELQARRYSYPAMIVGYELSKLTNRAYSDFVRIAAEVEGVEMMRSECRFANGNWAKFIGLDTDTVGLSVRTQFLFFNEFSEFRKYEDIKPLIDRCNGLVFIDTNPIKFAAENMRRLKEDYGDLVTEVKVTYKDNEFLPAGEVEMIEAKRRVGEHARVGSRSRWEYEVFVLGNFAEIEVGEIFQFADFQFCDLGDFGLYNLFGIIDPSARKGGDCDNCARGLFGFANVAGEERLVMIDSHTDNTSTMDEIAAEQLEWRKTYGNFVTYCEVNGYGKDFIRDLTNRIGRKNVGGYVTSKEKFSKIWDSQNLIKNILFVSSLQNSKYLRNVCTFGANCAHDDEADALTQAANFDYRHRRFLI